MVDSVHLDVDWPGDWPLMEQVAGRSEVRKRANALAEALHLPFPPEFLALVVCSAAMLNEVGVVALAPRHAALELAGRSLTILLRQMAAAEAGVWDSARLNALGQPQACLSAAAKVLDVGRFLVQANGERGGTEGDRTEDPRGDTRLVRRALGLAAVAGVLPGSLADSIRVNVAQPTAIDWKGSLQEVACC